MESQEEKPFECRYCIERFTTLPLLQEHGDKAHSDFPFPCSLCEYRGKKEWCLAKHSARLHSSDRPYQCTTRTSRRPFRCSLCGESFSQMIHLRSHTLRHTGEKPYKCRVCDFTSAQYTHLKLHWRTAHETCSSCNVSNVTARYVEDRLCSDCGAVKEGRTPAHKRQDQLFHYLLEHLPEAKFLFDKQVPGNTCSRRRPDVYCLTHLRRIFGECDENQHKAESYTCIEAGMSDDHVQLTHEQLQRMSEDARMSEMATTGEISPSVFIRLNPDQWKDETGKVRKIPLQDRFERFVQEFQHWSHAETQPHYAMVVYLFYDGPMVQYDYIPISPEELAAKRQPKE